MGQKAETPLDCALEKGRPESVDALLERRAKTATKASGNLLHRVLRSDSRGCHLLLEVLLDHGVDPNEGDDVSQDMIGMTRSRNKWISFSACLRPSSVPSCLCVGVLISPLLSPILHS